MKSRIVSALRSMSSGLAKLADRWDDAQVDKDTLVEGAIVVAAGSLVVVAAVKAPIVTVAIIGLYCLANGLELKYRKTRKKPVQSVRPAEHPARSLGAAAADDPKVFSKSWFAEQWAETKHSITVAAFVAVACGLLLLRTTMLWWQVMTVVVISLAVIAAIGWAIENYMPKLATA